MRVSHACAVALVMATAVAAASEGWRAYLDAGNEALTRGDLSGALSQYHGACDAAPKEYSAFHRRATVYLALGRTRLAVKDLDRVLTLKPDFIDARKRRAGLLVKHGLFTAARRDFDVLEKEEGGDAAATRAKAQAQRGEMEQAIAHIEAARQAVDSAEQQQQQQQQGATGSADEEEALRTALAHYAVAVTTVSSDGALRLERARVFARVGQKGEAVGDAMRAAKLTPGNTDAYLLLAQLYYSMGERGDALEQIRECVKLDADHKECFKLYKKMKKFVKVYDKLVSAYDRGRYAEAIMHMDKARTIEPDEEVYQVDMLTKECVGLAELQRTAQAGEACGKLLEREPESKEGWKATAKLREAAGEFESAVEAWQHAAEIDEDDRSIKEGLKRAQKLLKNSLKRDYYKILGVPRTATKRQITKAYRELALKWHPDKFEGEKAKAEAEKKFMDLSAAKEVLTDEEKRKMFDNGEDPLDAEEERDRNQRGSPFGGGGFPFGAGGGFGGGGGQRFHFRYQ
eukprot:UC1_evm1s111